MGLRRGAIHLRMYDRGFDTREASTSTIFMFRAVPLTLALGDQHTRETGYMYAPSKVKPRTKSLRGCGVLCKWPPKVECSICTVLKARL